MNEDVPSRELSYPTLEKSKFIFKNALKKGDTIFICSQEGYFQESENGDVHRVPACHVGFQVFFCQVSDPNPPPRLL